MRFLSAHWSNLILINYAVEPDFLARFCPRHVKPDTLDGKGYVSLVAFDFLDTRVLGIPWPGFRNFPEINLRFYVRQGGNRGVCFIQELVPSKVVFGIARLTYNEPYYSAVMSSGVRQQKGYRVVSHKIRWNGRTNRIAVAAKNSAFMPDEDSREEFFKEHQWGFGRDHFGRTLRYEVRHPRWRVYEVKELRMDWNWEAVYGREWKFLNDCKPESVYLAQGSKVEVRSPTVVS
ncbi:MAG: DUF2071 domain-containing protein [Candidatus Sumerlaeia bacterium]|nr:DUF2071 domain-containing protein [Candidatus Sumerlaeia bacterium]